MYKGYDISLDKEDLCLLDHYTWYIHKSGKKRYLRGYKKNCRQDGLVYMHRLILGFPGEVDHINGNGLDNRRCNLRSCNRSQNNANRFDDGSKGVHFENSTKRFRAIIHYNKKRINIGRFNTFTEAKNAYNTKSKELFGRFSCIS